MERPTTKSLIARFSKASYVESDCCLRLAHSTSVAGGHGKVQAKALAAAPAIANAKLSARMKTGRESRVVAVGESRRRGQSSE